MTIETALNKAIKGGYLGGKPKSWSEKDLKSLPLNNVFLDREFWICLGKAMKWGNVCLKCEDDIVGVGETGSRYERKGCDNCGSKAPYKMWKTKWHHFIEALAEGRTAEEFFTEL